jgi:hypothetical protein
MEQYNREELLRGKVELMKLREEDTHYTRQRWGKSDPG